MKYVFLLLFLLVPAVVASRVPGENAQPDLTFRLSTIERRIDQMQSRLDLLEREVRAGSPMGQSRPEYASELRQQYLGLSEQVSFMQMQIVEARKAIDKLNDAESKRNETREQPKAKDEKKKP